MSEPTKPFWYCVHTDRVWRGETDYSEFRSRMHDPDDEFGDPSYTDCFPDYAHLHGKCRWVVAVDWEANDE